MWQPKTGLRSFWNKNRNTNMPTFQMVSSYIEAYFNFKILQVLITSFSVGEPVHELDACTDEPTRDEQPELPERDECRYLDNPDRYEQPGWDKSEWLEDLN